MRIELNYDAAKVSYTVNNRTLFSVDISDFQHGTPVAADDVHVGDRSVTIRLGRNNDMFMMSAFKENGNQVCAKHLMTRLRDGADIGVTRVGGEGGREIYGITYGRNHDLYNEYAIRDSDFLFCFDPREPRTGHDRDANTPIRPDDHHNILDDGCK